jgi:hypothetical protein
VENFWVDRNPAGVRANVGVNRESTAFEAHMDYWKSTRNHPIIVQLILGLLAKANQTT